MEMITYEVQVDENGYRAWYINDKLHREDGPAVEYANGYRGWWLNGKRHREDGPAVEWVDGTREWWLNGKKVTEEEFNKRQRSREDKPVEIDGNRHQSTNAIEQCSKGNGNLVFHYGDNAFVIPTFTLVTLAAMFSIVMMFFIAFMHEDSPSEVLGKLSNKIMQVNTYIDCSEISDDAKSQLHKLYNSCDRISDGTVKRKICKEQARYGVCRTFAAVSAESLQRVDRIIDLLEKEVKQEEVEQ